MRLILIYIFISNDIAAILEGVIGIQMGPNVFFIFCQNPKLKFSDMTKPAVRKITHKA